MATRRKKGDLSGYQSDDLVKYPMETEAWLLQRAGVHHRKRGISRKAYVNLAILRLVTADEAGEQDTAPDAPTNL